MRRETTHFSATDELIKRVGSVKNWGSGGGVATPFLLHYPLVAVGSTFYRIEPRYSPALYVAWVQDDGEAVFMFDQDDMMHKAQLLVKQPDLLAQKYDEWRKYRDLFYEWLGQSRQINRTRYLIFEKLYIDEYSRAFYIEPFIFADALLEEIVEKYGSEFVQAAIKPRQLTFVGRLRERLVAAALDGDRSKYIDDIYADFKWVRNNYRDTDTYTKEDIDQEINQIIKENDAKSLKQELSDLHDYHKIQESELMEIRHEGTPAEWLYLDAFALVSLWLDQRKEANLRAGSVINNYLNQVSQTLEVKLIDLQYLVSEELELILDGSKHMADFPVAERRRQCIEIAAAGLGEFLLSGEELDLFAKLDPNIDRAVDVNEVSGVVAMPGKVVGKVRVVLDPSKAKDFHSGEILVAFMTRPDYVPLMKKAGAIITNEGGITSHAAIVARELKIPCIIGTKHATQVFKDGDMVEVDADRGIVKKI